jgi:2-polyprenyl-3-methyl-5-hydroxy-6-metoxy-1,4-benzoquinol methylase
MSTEPSGIAIVFNAFAAYQRTGALKAGVELDVFTAIGAGDATVSPLARRCGAAERGIRALCDALVALGFLAKDGDRWALTPDSAAFLDRRSPAYIGSALQFLASPLLFSAFADVAAAVRKGGSVLGGAGSMEPEHPMWVEFARGMGPLAAIQAELVANLVDADAGRPWKVLDVAAGHGLFGITIARRNPRADVVALDWRSVLAVADENARAAGVADRVRMLPGSAFDIDWGRGYDLVLLTNFLHHFDRETCTGILRKTHAALAPGGRAVALEFVPNEDRVSPPEAATFALTMLVTTTSGDAYTYAEYQRMFRDTGFARTELHELPVPTHRVVVAQRS